MSQNQATNIQSHILSRFTVLKKIGSGAYGHVWKVEDKISKKIFALKKIFDAFQHSTDAQRTYRQIQILKQIDHPNIIKLYQSIKAENNRDVYLIFQFMEADLHNVIAQGILRQVHIRFIVYQLAKALKYLHSGLVIHRDLKPSNILINSNCIIKLCDFGLVRSILPQDQNAATLTEGVATRWYRAPEVLLGSTRYSTPADIWSFGCIIYEILAQRPMFPGQNTTDQLNKIITYSGYPTQQQLKSLKSDSARSLLKQAKIPYYPQSYSYQGNTASSTKKQMLKDLPPLLAELIRRMTVLNPSQRITVQEILNHEAVQTFRKKEEEVQSKKIIVTEINDNRKLSVDQYRSLVYGIKRAHSMDAVGQTKTLSSKKSLLTHYSSNNNIDSRYQKELQKQKLALLKDRQKQKQKSFQQKQKQYQRYIPKYVRSKQMKSSAYNKSMDFPSNSGANNYSSLLNSNIDQSKKAKQEKTAQSRNINNLSSPTNKNICNNTGENSYNTATTGNQSNYPSYNYSNQLLKDPTRMSYISKTFYSPKYINMSKPISTSDLGITSPNLPHSHTSHTLNSSSSQINNSYTNNSSYTYSSSMSSHPNANNVNTSTSSSTNINTNTSSKIGSSYTSSSAYTHNRKPMLFKSSKYVTNVGNRNQENFKE